MIPRGSQAYSWERQNHTEFSGDEMSFTKPLNVASRGTEASSSVSAVAVFQQWRVSEHACG